MKKCRYDLARGSFQNRDKFLRRKASFYSEPRLRGQKGQCTLSLDSEKIFIRIGSLSAYRRPSGIKREAGARPARSRRCNRGRNLQPATAFYEKDGKAQGVERSGSQKTCL
jgi:hypothetical protein